MEPLFSQCAQLLEQADGLLITAGAGIGVDSGLPDFRGKDGFWKAYPALEQAKISFEAIASPRTFEDDPTLAWGFYGHRLQLYRNTVSHLGFQILREIAESMPNGVFVYTSNVDGQFQKAGFAEKDICERHGSIHHLQCMDNCTNQIWEAKDFAPIVASISCRLQSPLPSCPTCGELARPNVLMFNDYDWLPWRSDQQQARLMRWLGQCDRVVCIEIGAVTKIPTARMFGATHAHKLIRINLREPEIASNMGIGLPMAGLAAMQGIKQALDL